jgi:DNA-dependent RNA polymerase auxiliary subunit epsilon
MEIETFCEDVVKCLGEMLDEDSNVQIIKISKNNGVCLHGIIIRRGETQCSPSIYLEDYIQMYRTGQMSINEVACAVEKKSAALEKESIEPVLDFSWETLKDKVFCRLINLEWNEEKLQTMPYQQYLDFAIVCRIYLYADEKGTASSEVTYDVLEVIGVTEEELFRQALENTERLFPAEIKSLAAVVKSYLDRMLKPGLITEKDLESGVPLYILTNTTNMNGAIVIMYQEVLKQIAIQLKADTLYLLPSSIHEFLVMNGDMNLEEMKDMVEEANHYAVANVEWLSNHIYRYDKATDRVEIAA